MIHDSQCMTNWLPHVDETSEIHSEREEQATTKIAAWGHSHWSDYSFEWCCLDFCHLEFGVTSLESYFVSLQGETKNEQQEVSSSSWNISILILESDSYLTFSNGHLWTFLFQNLHWKSLVRVCTACFMWIKGTYNYALPMVQADKRAKGVDHRLLSRL